MRLDEHRIVVALGGNAILRSKQLNSYTEQYDNIRRTCEQIVQLIAEGYQPVLTHGNGPQVGTLLIQNEAASHLVPAVPLDVCGAETQGQIGYMIQQALKNALRARGLARPVASIVTQVLVDADDPAFATPVKPIGPFLPRAVAEQRMRDKREVWTEVDARGWRKLVPSPQPLGIVEVDVVHALLDVGAVVIACGGGGVPVLRRPDGRFEGVEAVVDKDSAAARLALEVRAAALLILTDVPGVAVDFGKPTQQFLRRVTLSELEGLLVREPFSAGSMGPKVRAAYRFVHDGGGQATICALEDALEGVRGRAGTLVVPNDAMQLSFQM
ncbi:MAG: carbamate kinase [Candidatus Rokubacteria bacterium]|nr:carbamate kinase [Candidatus Rokubacteria bacterium]